MREVFLHRLKQIQIGMSHELRPALAVGDPPGSVAGHTRWPDGQVLLERPADFCR